MRCGRQSWPPIITRLHLELPASQSERIRTLLVEPSDDDARALALILNGGPVAAHYTLTRVSTLGDAVRTLHDSPFDLVISELDLPDCAGLSAVPRILEAAHDIAIVVVSGKEDDELAFEAIRAGAQDYLVKGVVTAGQVRRSVRFSRERKRNELRFLRMAHQDPLTGLANRRSTQTQLSRMVVRYGRLCRRFSVLYLDLDGFKSVNDEHGHDVGDALLKEVGQRLRRSMRAYDLCARLGGDEFVVLVDSVEGLTDLHMAPSRIVATLSEPFHVGDLRIDVSASVGVAVFPESGRTAEQLLKRADEQLYEAKKSGKNRYIICEDARERFARTPGWTGRKGD